MLFLLYAVCVHVCVCVCVCQGERGPSGPALVGPRGIPGIPGAMGEQVSDSVHVSLPGEGGLPCIV